MRAVLVSEFGGPEQLRMGRVVIRWPGQDRCGSRCGGRVNPVDAGNRADGGWAGLRVPCILGYDIAGVIDGVGPGVTGLAPGDRVMAMTHFPDGAGGYAELAVIDAALAAPIGATTSFAAAAATPLAAGTASVVLGRLGLPPGSRLSCWAPAAAWGCSCCSWPRRPGSPRSGPAVRRCTRRCAGWAPRPASTTPARMSPPRPVLADGPVDAVANLVGGSLAQAALPALRPGGQIAAIASPELDLDPLLDANVTFHGVLLRDDGDRPAPSPACLTRRPAARRRQGCPSRQPARHTGSWKTGTSTER